MLQSGLSVEEQLKRMRVALAIKAQELENVDLHCGRTVGHPERKKMRNRKASCVSRLKKKIAHCVLQLREDVKTKRIAELEALLIDREALLQRHHIPFLAVPCTSHAPTKIKASQKMKTSLNMPHALQHALVPEVPRPKIWHETKRVEHQNYIRTPTVSGRDRSVKRAKLESPVAVAADDSGCFMSPVNGSVTSDFPDFHSELSPIFDNPPLEPFAFGSHAAKNCLCGDAPEDGDLVSCIHCERIFHAICVGLVNQTGKYICNSCY